VEVISISKMGSLLLTIMKTTMYVVACSLAENYSREGSARNSSKARREAVLL
jgi:hypothetical protein